MFKTQFETFRASWLLLEIAGPDNHQFGGVDVLLESGLDVSNRQTFNRRLPFLHKLARAIEEQIG